MSLPDDRCPTCDRANGWKAPTHEGQVDGCECPYCQSLCWDGQGPQCLSRRVNWRARHLAWKWHREVWWVARHRVGYCDVFASVAGESVDVGVVVVGLDILDLDDYSTAERFSLYEALRKHAAEEARRDP